MKIISRKDAIDANNPKYFTGKPCKNGHIAYRYTDSGTCVGCIQESRKKLRGKLSSNSPTIMTRQEAKSLNLNKYFTGKPCKNGHIAYRYTDSGTCYDCINRSRIAPDSQIALARDVQLLELAARLSEKRQFLDDLVEMNLIVHPTDVDIAKAIVLGFAMGRSSLATIADVWSWRRPKVGLRHHVKCHPDDVRLILDAAAAMYQAHRPDIEAIRNDIIGKVERELTEDVGYDLKETFK